jgi:hypothetical protein
MRILGPNKYLLPVRFQDDVPSPFGFGSSRLWVTKIAILELHCDKRGTKMNLGSGSAIQF